MAREIVTKSGRFFCVSMPPDFCKTPAGPSTPPIPYVIKGEFLDASGTSRNIKSNGDVVVKSDSTVIPSVTGDMPGTAKGVKSSTVGKRVQHDEKSKTVSVNGERAIRKGDVVKMNDNNTTGKIHERAGQGAKPEIKPATGAQTEAPPAKAPPEKDFGDKVDDVANAAADKINAAKAAVANKVGEFGQTAVGSKVMGALKWVSDKTELTAVKEWKEEAAKNAMNAAEGIGGRGAGVAGSLTVAALEFVPTSLLDLIPGGGKAAGTAGKLAGAAGKLEKLTATGAKLENAIVKGAEKLGEKVGGKVASKAEEALGKAGKAESAAAKAEKGAAKAAKGKGGSKAKGKGKKDRKKKKEKKKKCCPRNKGAGDKPTVLPHPVDLANGEEMLDQTDFTIDGQTPLIWTRSYRSGSETEDWGLFGARWATMFTTRVSVTPLGIVYHDDEGRAVRLPGLAIGQRHDSRCEGFIIERSSERQFTLFWRSGAQDTFLRAENGWLPHGYMGINITEEPEAPLACGRYYLSRSQAADGQGFNVERFPQAQVESVLLRVRTDDGICLEALRAPLLQEEIEREATEKMQAERAGTVQTNATGQSPSRSLPRIGQIDQVFANGSRLCHVRYSYAPDAGLNPAHLDDLLEQTLPPVIPPQPRQPFEQFSALPQRFNLVAQSDILGHSRHYRYRHHLLEGYSTYTGFEHTLEWVSLESLHLRWDDFPLSDAQLRGFYPVTLDNSYRARAIRTATSDGSEPYLIEYPDPDTTRLTEPGGGVFLYTFNDDGLATRVHQILPDGSVNSLGRREWDDDGMLLADIDAMGHAKRYTYDAAGNLISSTDALGYTTHIGYDSTNRVNRVTDALGHSSHNEYDAQGRLLSAVDALGRRTEYRYDVQGRLATIIDAKGGSKTLSYDHAGRVTSYTDCSGHATHFAYDGLGRMTRKTDALGQRTEYHYDLRGRLNAVIYPDHTQEQFEYDADDNLLCHLDAKGQATRYRYNGQGLPLERIDAKGQHLRYGYDVALRLVELVNGNDEHYTFQYHPQGWLAQETGFDGKATRYDYDKAGRLTASECNGQRVELMRDANGQLRAKGCQQNLVHYRHDALGRLVAVASPHSQLRYLYDAGGQLLEERSASRLEPDPEFATRAAPWPTSLPDSRAFVLRHAYDELGNRMQTILPNGRKVDTLRYGSGHWHGTQWQGTALLDLERDQLHRERVRELGQGHGQNSERMTLHSNYDPQSRLSFISLGRGMQQLRRRQYHYDSTGNLTDITDSKQGYLAYRYDPLGQLMSAVQPGLAETFSFDPAGNLLDPEAVPGVATSAPPAQNGAHGRELQDQPAPSIWQGPDRRLDRDRPRLSRVTHNLLQSYVGIQYEYDIQGNTVLKRVRYTGSVDGAGELKLEYDDENRLITARKDRHQARMLAEYRYDAFNRRIAKRVTEQTWAKGASMDGAPAASRSKTTYFVWDGDVLAQEIDEAKTITYLYEPESFVPVARIESAENDAFYAPDKVHIPPYRFADQTSPPGNPAQHVLAWRVHEARECEQLHHAHCRQREADAEHAAARDRIHYYQCDQLGTPLELLDEDGNAVWAVRYKAWGRVWQYDAREVEQPLRFQGQYWDAETGLHYNRHRYYDPDAARFVTQDPIGLMGGANAYSYAPNSQSWIDPLGLSKKHCPTVPDCDPCDSPTKVDWTPHGNKHVPPKNASWKDIVSSTKTGAAKYIPGTSIETIERAVWATGTKVSTGGKNTTWKVAELPGVIGASEGKETSFIRIECSQGVIHGHPISQKEYLKLIKR
jgi:RHS repeat-associated protein